MVGIVRKPQPWDGARHDPRREVGEGCFGARAPWVGYPFARYHSQPAPRLFQDQAIVTRPNAVDVARDPEPPISRSMEISLEAASLRSTT